MVDPGGMAAARGSSGSREVVRPGFEAHYHVSLLTVRLPGGDNATADALSSNENCSSRLPQYVATESSGAANLPSTRLDLKRLDLKCLMSTVQHLQIGDELPDLQDPFIGKPMARLCYSGD